MGLQRVEYDLVIKQQQQYLNKTNFLNGLPIYFLVYVDHHVISK